DYFCGAWDSSLSALLF
nr:immunoglobulin light chain junction region [Macaca mulatta]MOX77940.1 immunoglobulin light chain junction region [Macaca mulatta]MOX78110.1 immunoglobulin light chain junction region [Macaca mulatta]MOX78324.1 immunoglobulin light chain junction region [Macaca mulatta]MOX79158.1 immunoglobulin light chain junction region [Macaca mulatta]